MELMWSLIAQMNGIMVEVEAMKAANAERQNSGEAVAYREEAFLYLKRDLQEISQRLLNMG
ncbi:MAG: hypothetical protein PHI12_10880 [Dehalococcoidales bacterium]|nr:hypothetical protein [Dehalococcoidales bacterium]